MNDTHTTENKEANATHGLNFDEMTRQHIRQLIGEHLDEYCRTNGIKTSGNSQDREHAIDYILETFYRDNPVKLRMKYTETHFK